MKLKFNLQKIALLTLTLFLIGGKSVLAQLIISSKAKSTIFAPGVISTAEGEFAPTFAPDGKTVYFTGGPNYIYYSKLEQGKWAKPVLASFSGKWKDMDPFMSPDGKRIFFSSYRPYNGYAQLKFAHIWYVNRVGGEQWSEAHHIDSPVNLEGVNNYAPAVSKSGTLYFYSPNRDIKNKSTYYSSWLGDHYADPLLAQVNGDGGVHDPYISHDERFLIFASGGDLYISFKRDGNWKERQKLDGQVNDGGKNSSPSLSPDGKILYYSSSHENGILMIPVKIKFQSVLKADNEK